MAKQSCARAFLRNVFHCYILTIFTQYPPGMSNQNVRKFSLTPGVQPSAELFQVFDRLLLLKKGGQVVFFGDIGHHSSNLIKYFESNGARKCKPEENP